MTSLFENFSQDKLIKNSGTALFMEKSLQRKESSLGPDGELVVKTGKHTGRSANDKYVVVNDHSRDKIWWENNINKMEQVTFDQLKKDVIAFLNTKDELFATERSIGSSNHYALGIDFVSSRSSAALFTSYMFKEAAAKVNDTYQIIHAPDFVLDSKKYGTKSETVIVTCFKEKCTIIVGTFYAGEIKKSMFSIMNYLTPDAGLLPMHSGANQNKKGESFVFFGLSGTGKTTLSTDEGLDLIGDDEHGLSDKGVFNFEGGCYAKTFKLAAETEPSIYKASSQFGSFLENVKLSDDRKAIDFFDDSLTENGRSSYPLSFVEERVGSGEGAVPKHIFYLSADAFGVLPPVSLLGPEQAMDYFVLGYSAKLAGTEIGVKVPSATFSTCFGAPFMLRHPTVYSALLRDMMTKHKIKIWLVNTGWYGGAYGVGQRFPLKVTRNLIRQIQQGKLDNVQFVKDDIFGLAIPESVDGVETKILNPKNAWSNQGDYLATAKKLEESFRAQLVKMKG
jgi:phosphoenolpyruvate carboxykinase (ATP)